MISLEEIQKEVQEREKLIDNMTLKSITLEEQKLIYTELKKRVSDLEQDIKTILRNGYTEKECIPTIQLKEKIGEILLKFEKSNNSKINKLDKIQMLEKLLNNYLKYKNRYEKGFDKLLESKEDSDYEQYLINKGIVNGIDSCIRDIQRELCEVRKGGY